MSGMNKNYIVYHLHSDLSNGVTNIDSVTKYKEYVEYAKSLGMTAMAFAEHGNIFEWVHKKEAIEAAGMKYIHAAEVYLTTDKNVEDKHRDNYHCVLIAKNYDGVKELNKLISASFNRDDYHYYYAPRIGFEELYATSDNIIITTACLGGVLNKADNNIKTEFLRFLIKNKHRCYLEIQHHNCIDQSAYNKVLYTINQKTGVPLIAGTDTHCLNDTHIEGRSILQKAKNVFFSDEESWDLTFKTYDELVEAYKKQNSLPEEVYLEAIENTNAMADSVEPFKLDYNKKYPKLYNDSEKALKEKILKGIKNRGVDKYDNFDEYKKKIQYELETYSYNGAIDFLLLEEDYKSALKSQGVSYGYSRGSVSGSIIAYLLGITEVDSIKYNLNFER
jgi:DNA polymerase-3 subunit alpha